MAQSLKVVDKMPSFKRSVHHTLDDAIRSGARDVLIKSKNNAPFKKGQLRANTDIRKIAPMHQRVSFYQEYARFQELGGDKKRRVRNYTTPGTGKKYLKNAGDDVADKLDQTLKIYARRARP